MHTQYLQQMHDALNHTQWLSFPLMRTALHMATSFPGVEKNTQLTHVISNHNLNRKWTGWHNKLLKWHKDEWWDDFDDSLIEHLRGRGRRGTTGKETKTETGEGSKTFVYCPDSKIHWSFPSTHSQIPYTLKEGPQNVWSACKSSRNNPIT